MVQTTKEQEYARQKLVEKGVDTLEPFGTCVTSINTHINGKKVVIQKLKFKGKGKFVTENKSPIAILHETSMSIDDDSANEYYFEYKTPLIPLKVTWERIFQILDQLSPN